MKDCFKYKQLFMKAIYSELEYRQEESFKTHLNECEECSNEFNGLMNTLNSVKQNERPEPDEEFMNNFWEILEPKLTKQPRFKFGGFKNMFNLHEFRSTWKYQLTAATVILIIGIFIGKYFYPEHENSVSSVSPKKSLENSMPSELNAEAANYIERSKVLLLGLMNYDPSTDDAETINLPRQRKISRELLSQANTLKTNLKKPSQLQMKRLVSDIELVLMQIANLETNYDLSGIELIKDGVNRRNILLKINLEEMKESSIHHNRQQNKLKKENKKYNPEI